MSGRFDVSIADFDLHALLDTRPMLRTPFIETLSDLFIRSAQWRGRDELFVDDTDRITGAEALDSALRISQGFADHGAGRAT